MTSQSKGLFGALLDLSFSEFVTTKIIRVLYVIALVLIALGAVFGLISGLVTLFNSFWQGLLTMILAAVGALLSAIIARIWLELIIVVFKIAENTSELVHLKRSGS